MPWVDQDKCVGCGICVEKCPVGEISMENGKARINMVECIRCGICHDICPQEAVRHDSERIEYDTKANVEMTKRFMEACKKHLGKSNDANNCLNRMIKHFNKERVVAEKTLEELKKLRSSQ
jgi:ferredoxin